MKIKRVRFKDNPKLGYGYVPISTFAQGDQFEGGRVKMSKYDDSFLELRYEMEDAKRTYSQLVPWTSVDAVFID